MNDKIFNTNTKIYNFFFGKEVRNLLHSTWEKRSTFGFKICLFDLQCHKACIAIEKFDWARLQCHCYQLCAVHTFFFFLIFGRCSYAHRNALLQFCRFFIIFFPRLFLMFFFVCIWFVSDVVANALKREWNV